MEAKDLHGGLGVRVERGFEAELVDACGIGRGTGTNIRGRMVSTRGWQRVDPAHSAQRTELGEERLHHADEVAERQAVVSDDALDLVELGEVRRVQALVAEDAVNRKVLDRLEALSEEWAAAAPRLNHGSVRRQHPFAQTSWARR